MACLAHSPSRTNSPKNRLAVWRPVEHSQYWDRGHVPYGFSVIRIARPVANQVPRWQGNDSGSEPTLTHALVAKHIERKNERLPDYRANFDQSWLILISTLFPLSSSFTVPPSARDWKFDFDFDKVLLVSQWHGVLNLLRKTAP